MNIITVIPLSNSKISGELSYFTSTDVPIGAIVTVPLRSKSIHAVVTKSEDAVDQKMDIKKAGFIIRKLGKIKAVMFFPPAFIAASNKLSIHYATTIGAIIDTMVARTILDQSDKIRPPLPRQNSFETAKPKNSDPIMAKNNIFAIQANDLDRISSWRSLIRQEFARKRSIVIYTPTIADSEYFYKVLEKGIEGYIFKLNGDLTKKQIVETWTKISETLHPIVVIATGSFPILPRDDIDTIIIERENSRNWRTLKAPYLDIRHALETIGLQSKQSIYLADSLLSIETLHRLETENIEEGSPFKWRSISTAQDKLVDMKIKTAKADGFRILSKELEELIRANQEQNTHLFILTLRRGHSPLTVCDDCETIVMCKNCSAPVVLHTSTESGRNFFMCHKCGERCDAEENCISCGSWRLTPLGIGIDKVALEIKTKFPDIDLFQIDKDLTETDKKVNDTLDKFKSHPGSILLGTDMAALYLLDRIDHVAIASLDSLFALPDFRIQEKIMHTLVRLRGMASRTIMVQTRHISEKVFEYGLKGNLSDFYRSALAERKQFQYPPYTVLVKITIEGEKEKISKQMAVIQKILDPADLNIFPAFTSTVRGKSVIHGLLSIESHSWPDPVLIDKIRQMPPDVSVKINPESLL
ncbi:MAG: hypothetical protein WC648_00675 [Candidatus Paceibacterota bacterium]|jgi:primosomal protein N'